ncbi:MAG: sodium:proton antiporter [Clostridia bacterium]|nr:sodium:proton antiporter [Clostridia bacterium]
MTDMYTTLFTGVLVILGILMIACLIRAILGPRTADRLVSMNMTGTLAMMMIAILAWMLDAGYLLDVALIYAMLSFLAVVVLVKVFIGEYAQKHSKSGGEAET